MEFDENQEDRFLQLANKILDQGSTGHSALGRFLRLPLRLVSKFFRKKESNIRDKILREFSDSTSNVYFVQIGSCDGVTGDPIYKYIDEFNWCGVVVEPVPYAFESLVQNYKENRGVACENVAISTSNEKRAFWHLRKTKDNLPHWYNQIGSFNRDHVLKHSVFIPNIEDYIVQTDVECMTFAQLIEKHGIEKIDLLHIDVEGYDFEIIKQIDFSSFRPIIIIYEDLHLTEPDRWQCQAHLNEQGYRVVHEGIDCVAVRKDWDKGQLVLTERRD